MALPTNVFDGGAGAAALGAFFKTRYPQRKIEDLVKFEKPLLGELSQSDELTGIATIVPMQLGDPQGVGANIRTAIDNASPLVGRAWSITPASYYGGMRIDARTLMASRNDQGAFFKVREREYEGILNTIGLTLEKYLWSDGTASLGILAADPGTATTVTLATPADAINFQAGQTVRFYDNDGTGGAPSTLRAGGVRVLAGVNYVTGVLTFTAAVDAALDAGDHVIRDGDVNGVLKGVPAWIPAADPTDTFFGVARTNFPQMLGGWRQAYLGSIEETVKALDTQIRRVSQNPKVLWLSFSNWNRLEIELGARGYRMEDGTVGKFGRPSLMMTCPGGPVICKAGPFVPESAAFLLDMSTWKLMTLGALPHLVEDDGLTARVVGVSSRDGSLAEDGIEIRLRYFAQLVCLNPFANGRAAIS